MALLGVSWADEFSWGVLCMRKMIDCFPGWGGSNLGATFCPKLYEYIMFSFFPLGFLSFYGCVRLVFQI